MVFIHLFYACLELRFPDVETPGVLFLVPAEYSAVICRAFPGSWATWQWLRLSTIYCCALKPWSQTSIIYRRRGSCIWSSCLVVPDGMPRACGMAAYVRDGYGTFRQPKLECGCREMLVFRVCGGIFFFFSLYFSPDLDDWIYECLQTTIAAV